LEVAGAPDALERRDLTLHLIHRARERVLDASHALHCPLRGRQWRVRIERVLGRVLRRAKRLPEPESAEVVLESGVVRVAQQAHGLRLGVAEVNGPKRADALA